MVNDCLYQEADFQLLVLRLGEGDCIDLPMKRKKKGYIYIY